MVRVTLNVEDSLSYKVLNTVMSTGIIPNVTDSKTHLMPVITVYDETSRVLDTLVGFVNKDVIVAFLTHMGVM